MDSNNNEIKPTSLTQLLNLLKVGQTRRVVIAPELAQELFDKRLVTRTIKPEHAAAIAADIRDGYWVEKSPVPIIIDPRGIVIDGQHRLSAILSIGRPVVFSVSMVSQALAEELVSVLDTNVVRSPADRLRVKHPDLSNTREIVAWMGAMCLMAYHTTKLHKMRARIDSVYTQLHEPLSFCNEHKIRPAIIQGAAAFAWVRQPEAAHQFALQFTGMADRPASSPVALLERSLREGTYGSVHTGRYATAAKVVAAIEGLAEGRTLKRLLVSEELLDAYRESWRQRFPDLDVELTTAGVLRSQPAATTHAPTHRQLTLPSPAGGSVPASASGLHSRSVLDASPRSSVASPRQRGRPRKTGSGG